MHVEGIERIFRSGNCEFKARIRVRITVVGHSDRSKEAVSVRTIQVYTIVSSSGKNVHLDHINPLNTELNPICQ